MFNWLKSLFKKNSETTPLPVQTGGVVSIQERHFLYEILLDLLSDDCPAIYFEKDPNLRAARGRWGEPVFQFKQRPDESWHYGLSPYRESWVPLTGVYEKRFSQCETVTKEDDGYYDSLFGKLITPRYFYFE